MIPALPWVAPFVLLLLAIALLPLLPRTRHWWEHNRNKFLVSAALALVVIAYYQFRGFGVRHEGHVTEPGVAAVVAALNHAVLVDYVPFIVLLFALYTISGGIHVSGDIPARPSINTAILALGTLLASFIGTTGASMVLIRPLLEINRERRRVVHTVVFFIFLVSNIGGCLTPLGDPPLFLGYLRGVPFAWTFTLWPEWLALSAALLALYFVWDNIAYRGEAARDVRADEAIVRPLKLSGGFNFVWLAGVVASVALLVPGKPAPGTDWVVPPFFREGVLLALTALAWVTTPGAIRAANRFTFFAIIEVAALFIGIFITMQVPMEILQARSQDLGLTTPPEFFWATGTLSSFLDNAPTYVVFFQTASSIPPPAGMELLAVQGGTIPLPLLEAVSLGAVFMGANTYIGNGPNFMVKSIAEQSGVAMPSFFGYMLYSALILVPLFVGVTYLFLMRW